MVVHRREGGVLRQAHGIELTANGLDEVRLPFAIDLLEGAGTASLLVVGGEDAVTPIHDRGHLVAVFIEVADSLLLDDLEGCRGEEVTHMGQALAELLRFALLQRRTAIAFDAALPLTGVVVADEEYVEEVLTDDLIFYLDHSAGPPIIGSSA